MSKEDAGKYFGKVHICKYMDLYEYSYAENFGDNNGGFKFEIDEEGEYTFSVSQIDSRMYPKVAKYKNYPAKLFLLK